MTGGSRWRRNSGNKRTATSGVIDFLKCLFFFHSVCLFTSAQLKKCKFSYIYFIHLFLCNNKGFAAAWVSHICDQSVQTGLWELERWNMSMWIGALERELWEGRVAMEAWGLECCVRNNLTIRAIGVLFLFSVVILPLCWVCTGFVAS